MLLKGRSSRGHGDLGAILSPSYPWLCNKPTQAQWCKITIILLYARILWVRNLDKACQERFVSIPQYMGPHLVGLKWPGVTQMLGGGGWNHPEASSFTCLIAKMGWSRGWDQLGLSAGAFPCGLGFLMEWQLRIVGFLMGWPEAPKTSVLTSKVKGTLASLHHSLLVRAVTSLSRFKGWKHRPRLMMRGMSMNLWPFKNHGIPKKLSLPVGC